MQMKLIWQDNQKDIVKSYCKLDQANKITVFIDLN